MTDRVPDVFVVADGELRWRCRCGRFALVISALIPGVNLTHTCPHCGENVEFISAEGTL